MTTLTADALDFDPYREWLGITTRERPIGPYQLLQLTPLESDAMRIRAGFQRQEAALQAQLQSADGATWEAIRTELEAAFNLLSDPEQKAVLDASIRRRGCGPTPSAPKHGKAAGQASAAAGEVTCRHCQKSNPASRRFCGGCGKSLWEVCPQCQAECAADERFCGTCGCDIHGGLDEQSRQLEARFAEAQELLAAYRYDAAISALRGVAAVNDARFETSATKALAEIARVEQIRKDQQAADSASYAKALEHMSVFAYENAVSSLEDIPAPLRSAEAETLLAKARSNRKELLALGGEIRTLMEAKNPAELLPKIGRLLALKPNHKQAQQIAEQMRDSLVKSAKQKLAQHRYREALVFLEQIPAFVRTEEVEGHTDTASELLSLLDGVKNAALADKPTLALAERLASLAKTNAEAGQLRTQLAERIKAKPTDPHFAAPNYSPVPSRTLVGVPVDGLARLTRLPTAGEEITRALDDQPGQMFVALGLALQGMGLAAVPLDLMPREKQGMMGMLPGLPFGRRGPSAAWGLDLSEFGLKAIKLFHDPKPRKGEPVELRIEACEYLLHSQPLTHPDVEMERGEIVAATLKDFLSRCGELKGCKIAINVPGHRVLGRFFELPPLAAKKVPDAIAFEARHQLPVDLDQLCWDSHTLDAVDPKLADDQPRRIMVVSSRDAHVKDRVATFKSAGIAVDHVNSDSVALHNALVYEFFGDEAGRQREDAILTLDVGIDSTSVVISSPRSVWFRTFGLGGDQLTGTLVRQFKLTHDQAEKLKREPARARRFGQMQAAIQPFFVQMAGEVERSIANYSKLYPDHPVTQLYGVGGAFQTFGLLRHLRMGK